MRNLNEAEHATANIMATKFWKDYVPDGQGGQREVHKVQWSRRGDFRFHKSVETVQRMMKPHDDGSFSPEWEAIKPAYEAWLRNEEAPTTGTPLEAWAALNARQVEILRAAGYRAIEDVAAMTDDDMRSIRLPNVRRIRDTARAYIENRKGTAHIDAAMADMKAQNDDLREQLAEALALLKQVKNEEAA